MTKKELMIDLCIVIAVAAIILGIPLARIHKTGYVPGTLSLPKQILCGYIFPKETRLDDNYRFKNGDVLVVYRPSCPDCQKYIRKITKLMKSVDGEIYLCDKSETGKKHYDPAWVPSIVFFENDTEKVFEVRSDDDLLKAKKHINNR